METKKEWYEGKVLGHFRGRISEAVQQAKEGKLTYEFNKANFCDMCSFCTSIAVLTGIWGADTDRAENVMVVHGPTGCAQLQGTVVGARYVSTTMRTDISTKEFYIPAFVCSGIGEKEVIFGGIKKLERTIKYVDQKFKPKVIPVLTCCSTQVIGDDVEGLIKKLEKEVTADLIYIPTSGLNKSYEGYDLTYKALIDKFVVPSQDKIPGSVNIIGDKRRAGGEINFAEINRIFKKLGIKVNCRLARNTSLDEIRRLTEAQLNVMMCCHAGIFAAKYLKEKFGMPYLRDDYPWGLEETVRWYRQILTMLGMEDKEGVLEREYQQAYPRFAAAKKVLEGKRIVPFASPGRAVRIVDQIHELGMDIPIFGIYFHIRDDIFELLEEKLKKYGFDPEILVMLGTSDVEEIVATYKPDLFIGDPSYGLFSFKYKIGFAHLEMAPALGFSGTLNTAERWADAVRQPVYDFWGKYADVEGYTDRTFEGGLIW